MRRAIGAALAAAALLATGCGGGGDTPKVVTKALYIAEGDNVCAGISERFNTAGDADPQTPKQIVDSADALADIYGDLLEGLKKLTVPTSAAARPGAATYVSAIARTDTLVGQLRTSAQSFQAALKTKDNDKLTAAGNDVRSALDAFRASQVEANQRALAYGFTVCSSLN